MPANRNVLLGSTCLVLGGFTSLLGAGPAGFYCCRYTAAGAELAAHYSPDRIARFHYVFKDLVDDVFLEDSEVAVAEEIFLERFELEAACAGHVADRERAEVGQAGLGANGGQLGIVDDDFITGKLVLPGLDLRKLKVESGLGVIVGIARLLRHIFIVRRINMNIPSCKFLVRIHANFCFLRACEESYILA